MRQFIQRLKKQGQLTTVEDEVSPVLEASKLSQGTGPTLFKNIDGSKAIVNFVGSRTILAEALNVDERDLITKLARTEPTGTTRISDFDWPCKMRPDLTKLPIMKFFERDGGRYITAGILVAKYGEHINASIHRMMVLDPTSLAVRLVPPRHTYLMHRAAAQKGEPLNVAIAIGVDPVTLFGVSTRVPCGLEFNYVAALKQEVQPLVQCDNEIPVPPCEIVLEGYIHSSKTAAEGPFVDVTETYDVIRQEPVIELTGMKSNNDPIYHSIIPASVEHALLMGVPYEPLILKAGQRAAKVKNVVLTEGSKYYLHAVIQIEKQTEGDAKNVMMAAFAVHTSLKHVVVVDDDIDIYNNNDIEYAIATRVRGDIDLLTVPNVRGSSLDPSAAADGTTTKIGVDATAPLNERWKFERVR